MTNSEMLSIIAELDVKVRTLMKVVDMLVNKEKMTQSTIERINDEALDYMQMKYKDELTIKRK